MKKGDEVTAKVPTMMGGVKKGDIGVVTSVCGDTVEAEFDGGAATFCSHELSKNRERTLVKPFMRSRLPYGKWTREDGSEVLFNRGYQPIWQRKSQSSAAEEIGRGEWVNHVKEEWFYDDGSSPWFDGKTLKKCEAILEEWGVE